jgi:hypothetical protein
VKYMNVTARLENPYWSVAELQELKTFFAKQALVWASGVDSPNLAERFAYTILKDTFPSVPMGENE